jgi:2-oxoisovalerate dehydrogenase E2 component (dihydrolipoyl transacylase)
MARYTFNLPDIGEGITEAEIVAWHVKPGDLVAEDDRLADLMTDKATVEMESPVAGRVLQVAGEVGEVIAIGSALVVLETEGAGEAESVASSATEAAVAADRVEVEPRGGPVVEEAGRDANEGSSEASAFARHEPSGAPSLQAKPEEAAEPASGGAQAGAVKPGLVPAKVLASPAVRQRARDLGIDLAQVKPADHGRVRHADLDAFLSYGAARGYAPAAAARADESIKVVGLRRRIAENMAAAKRHIPHFTYVEECDVTALEALRAQLNGGQADRPKLTLLPLLITAICRALPQFPMLNARYDDEANVVTRHGAVHLGLATMTAAGLMVPVIRGAQALNLWQLAREITRLAEAAREGRAKAEELTGSTLTISSLGPLGGIASTPVVNRPEVAIIAPNRIVERPAFVPDGLGAERLEKRKLMNLSISCDHRVVDGYDAAAFVQEVKRLLEAPALILAG